MSKEAALKYPMSDTSESLEDLIKKLIDFVFDGGLSSSARTVARVTITSSPPPENTNKIPFVSRTTEVIPEEDEERRDE